jgi:hypothetical protein
MECITGEISVGEASAAMREIMSRLRGSQGPYSLVLAVLLVVCAGLGSLVWHSNQTMGMGVGALIGLLVYLLAYNRLTQFLFRRRFRERGLPLLLPVSVKLTDEALDYTIGEVREIAKWSAVTELFPNHAYWIFLAQGSAFFVPQRFFETKAEERAFIQAALAHMNESALACSPGAVKFAK